MSTDVYLAKVYLHLIPKAEGSTVLIYSLEEARPSSASPAPRSLGEIVLGDRIAAVDLGVVALRGGEGEGQVTDRHARGEETATAD